MKLLITSLILSFTISLFAAQSGTIEVKAAGMTCETCVNTLKGEIAKLDLKKYGPVQLDVAVNKVTINTSKVTPALNSTQVAELTKTIEGAVVAAKFELAPAKTPVKN